MGQKLMRYNFEYWHDFHFCIFILYVFSLSSRVLIVSFSQQENNSHKAITVDREFTEISL